MKRQDERLHRHRETARREERKIEKTYRQPDKEIES
jgi:hypothetical protein